jgi:nucleoside-diphosphate-sugar epimerase
MAKKRKVLITGGAGYIGTFLKNAWHDNYELVLTDHEDIEDPKGAKVIVGDIRDVETMRKACEGVNTVVHLAANPSPRGDFDSQVLPMNIIGTHNVYRVASEAGVKRVVFASSIHAVGGYPADVQVKWDMPVRPCCEYGASKCYGEALGRYFSDQKNMSVIAVRIGGVHGHDSDSPHRAYNPKSMDYLVSEKDLTQLLTKCVEAPDDLQFAIVHGLSDNRFKRLDISHTREVLGYEPEHDSAEDYDELEVPEPQSVHSE